jgi:hypothetical protein
MKMSITGGVGFKTGLITKGKMTVAMLSTGGDCVTTDTASYTFDNTNEPDDHSELRVDRGVCQREPPPPIAFRACPSRSRRSAWNRRGLRRGRSPCRRSQGPWRLVRVVNAERCRDSNDAVGNVLRDTDELG